MNATTGAFLVAAALVITAVLIARRTWRATRSAVVWMRPTESRIAHAIPMSELRAEPTEVEALARCARWPLVELEGDADAERCVPCMQAVEWAVRHHR